MELIHDLIHRPFRHGRRLPSIRHCVICAKPLWACGRRCRRCPTVTQDLSENVILTSLDDLHNWARLSSLWPLLYGTACCFIEFAALIGSRFDFDRFGLFPEVRHVRRIC